MRRIVLSFIFILSISPLFAEFGLTDALEDYSQWKIRKCISHSTIDDNVSYINDLSKRALDERNIDKAVAVQKMLEGQLLFQIVNQEATQSQAELMLVTAAMSTHVLCNLKHDGSRTISISTSPGWYFNEKRVYKDSVHTNQFNILDRAYEFGKRGDDLYFSLIRMGLKEEAKYWIESLKNAVSLRDLTKTLVESVEVYNYLMWYMATDTENFLANYAGKCFNKKINVMSVTEEILNECYSFPLTSRRNELLEVMGEAEYHRVLCKGPPPPKNLTVKPSSFTENFTGLMQSALEYMILDILYFDVNETGIYYPCDATYLDSYVNKVEKIVLKPHQKIFLKFLTRLPQYIQPQVEPLNYTFQALTTIKFKDKYIQWVLPVWKENSIEYPEFFEKLEKGYRIC